MSIAHERMALHPCAHLETEEVVSQGLRRLIREFYTHIYYAGSLLLLKLLRRWFRKGCAGLSEYSMPFISRLLSRKTRRMPSPPPSARRLGGVLVYEALSYSCMRP
jgi:hypothetical protein